MTLQNLHAQIPDDFVANTNGGVTTLAVQSDGKVLLGGSFSTVAGIARNRVARLNPDGSVDKNFNPNANGEVRFLAPQGDGRILMGGTFGMVGGVSSGSFVRVTADGKLDTSFKPNLNNTLYAGWPRTDGKIFVAGNFTTVYGITRNHLALLNENGTPDASFADPNANNTVSSLAPLPDGKVMIGGGFTSVSGVLRSYVARINADGTLDTTFSNPGINGFVSAIALQADGKLLVGGDFTSVGSIVRNRIARLHPDGSLDTGFNPNANGSVDSIVVHANGSILIGGGFTTVGGIARTGAARITPDGGTDGSYDPKLSGSVGAIAIQADGKALIGGNFLTASGVGRANIARLTSGSSATSSLAVTGTDQLDWMRGGSAPEVTQVSFEIWSPGGWTDLGMASRVAGGWRMTGMALPVSGWVRGRAQSSGGFHNGSVGWIDLVQPYGFPLSPEIEVRTSNGTSIAHDSGTVNVGTAFWPSSSQPVSLTINNPGSAALAGLAISVAGENPESFVAGTLSATTLPPGGSLTFSVIVSPQGAGAKRAILTIFSNDPDQTSFRINLEGMDSRVDPSFDPGATPVWSIATQADGRILVGGDFTTVDGVVRQRIARLDKNGKLDETFDPGANNLVNCLNVQSDNRILAAGSFTAIGGVERNRLARLNPDGTLDASFDPNVNAHIFATTICPDGRILIGGAFTSVDGVAHNRIARLNRDGTPDSSFNPYATGIVNSIALQTNGKVLMGGEFLSVNGVSRRGIARLDENGLLDQSFAPSGVLSVNALAVQSDGKILVGGSFAASGENTQYRINRLNTDGTPDDSFPGLVTSDSISSIVLQADGMILMGGAFTHVGGESRNRVARVRPDGVLDVQFNPDANGEVVCLALQNDGKPLAGGFFSTLGSAARVGIARLANDIPANSTIMATGGSTIDWVRGGSAPEIDQTTFEVWGDNGWGGVISATRIAGGWRMTIPPPADVCWIRARGCAIGGYSNGSSGWIQEIRSLGTPVAPDIGVAVDGGANLPSGSAALDFGNVPWLSPGILTLKITNTGNAALSGLAISRQGANPSDYSTSSIIPDTLATGDSFTFTLTFTPRGSGTRRAILAISSNDPDNPLFEISLRGSGIQCDATFNPNANGIPLALAMQPDGRILMAGAFTVLDGVPINRVARLNTDGTPDISFNPIVDNLVQSIIVQADGKILIGGAFITVGGVLRTGIARLNPDGTLDGTFNPGCNGQVSDMVVQPDGKILMIGSFTSVGGVSRWYIARLYPDGTLDESFYPMGYSAILSIALQDDGKILMGGGFDSPANRIVRLNPDGTRDTTFGASTDSYVYTLVPQPDGRVLVGGSFTTVSGGTRMGLARINADGSLDTGFNPIIDSDNPHTTITTLLLQADGAIIMGGNFNRVNGIRRNFIARIDSNGTPDETFDPNANDKVYALALQEDGRIIAGGPFTEIGGGPIGSIARLANDVPATSTLNITGGSNLDWMRSGSSPVPDQVNYEIWDGTAWSPLGHPVRIPGGWRLSGTNPPTGSHIRASGFIAGGYSNGSAGLVRQTASFGRSPSPDLEVAANSAPPLATGSAALDFGIVRWPLSAPPMTIELSNKGDVSLSGLTVAVQGANPGEFSVDQVSATTLAPGDSLVLTLRFAPTGQGSKGALISVTSNDPDESPFEISVRGTLQQSDSGFFPSADSTVQTLAMQPDGKILAGGLFSTLGGLPRNRIARIDTDGTADPTFNPGANDKVNAIAVRPDGKIMVGGKFSVIAGVSRNSAARLNENGTPDGSFVPIINGEVVALTVQADGKVLIGGAFTSVGGITMNRIARLNADGTPDTSFNPGSNGTVYALAVQPDGNIVIGGTFTNIAGTVRNRIARLKPNGTLDSTFNPNSNAAVNTIAIQPDGRILLGGNFTSIGGVSRSFIARLHSNGSLDASFVPSVNNSILSLVTQADGRVMIGGAFTSAGGIARNRIARFGANGIVDASFDPNANNMVYALASRPDGRILAAGDFTIAGGAARDRIVSLVNDIPSITNLTADGSGVIAWTLGGAAPEIQQATFEIDDGSGWASLGRATRVENGWRMEGLVLPATGTIRARGQTSGGYHNSGSGMIEQITTYGVCDIAVESSLGNDLPNRSGYEFGYQPEGSAIPVSFTIRNAGFTPLNLGTIALEGGNTSEFLLSTTGMANSLPPGGQTTVSVSFAPSTSGTKTTALSIASNDPDDNPFTLILTGTGNAAPAFSGCATATPYQTPSSIGLRKLLAKASDPDGDAISITSAGPVSANGGAVILLADAVGYTPPDGFSGTDTFTIVLTDAGGASITGTITVQVGSAPHAGMSGAGTNPPKLTTLPGGKMGLSFQGIPGRSYIIQRSAGGLDDWQTLATVIADATGKISYTDENPPPGSAFYRLGSP
ncbi:MAG: choice-of-anchor D domain-containing protein [Verrucomicrobia bacterium]|nr:choice-of-anchor D domain-containing protein [Verrucomicrobiota bacterium]